MKRERELEHAVGEIVREGKRKNEKGQPLYPVIYEPAVLAFFGAPEALFEVLMDRPLLVLSLLQTNKALQSFFAHFPSIWIKLTDALIEKAMGSYAAEIYPFFEILWKKEEEAKESKVAFIGNKKQGTQYHPFDLNNALIGYEDPKELVFYVVKPGGTWLSLYLELVTLLRRSGFTVDMLEQVGFLYNPKYREGLATMPITNITFWSIFSGTLVLAQKGAQQQATLPRYYDVREEIDAILRRRDLIFYRRGMDAHRIMYLAETLRDMLSETVTLETPSIIKLDERSAAEYRTQLYNAGEGLYPTSEAQKAFFFRVVRALSDTETKEEMIHHYGEPFTFNCLLCKQETELVDPQLLSAFCSTACRTKYDQ